MNRTRWQDQTDRLTAFLLRRPIVSTVFAVLPLLWIVDVLGFLELDYGPLNAFGYVAVAELVLAPVVVLLLPRWTRQSAAQLLLPRWAVAESPFLVAFASVMSGGPQWLIGFAFVETVALLIFSMKSAKDSASNQTSDS